MPSKSKKQHNFMAAIAHSPEFSKKAGVPMSVGKDFVKADKGRSFREDGGTITSKAKMNKAQTNFGEKQLPNASLNKYIGKKEGGMATKKMHSEKSEMKMDLAQDKKIVKKAFSMHDKQLHADKKTNLTKLARGGGIEIKGKTKGTMIKMCGGGMKGK
jgi:hypothetical protein